MLDGFFEHVMGNRFREAVFSYGLSLVFLVIVLLLRSGFHLSGLFMGMVLTELSPFIVLFYFDLSSLMAVILLSGFGACFSLRDEQIRLAAFGVVCFLWQVLALYSTRQLASAAGAGI